MDVLKYGEVWKQETTLENLNASIHDNAPVDDLAERGRGFRKLMFETLFPVAAPPDGARMLEFGSGVGWIMQAMIEAYPLRHIVGVDISQAIARHARERLADPRASFVVYDGLRLPFPDDRYATIYSCSAIHHIEKHVAFLLFRELYRILAPGGHAVLQFLALEHMARAMTPYDTECWNHIHGNVDAYWHHYYGFDELVVLFSELIGVDELDIQPAFGDISFFVHFSKKTGRRFLRPEVPALTYRERVKALATAAQPPPAPVEQPSSLRRWLGRTTTT